MPSNGPRQDEREQVEEPQVLIQTAQPAMPAIAPLGGVGMSAIGRMSSPERAQLARSLAGHMGNAAFSRMIMRAPDGPLAKLRDELDDTFVDEDDCLTWIGQLGPGEKTLVGRDATMRQQMIDAFNVQEMLRAVEMLALPVKHQIDWIRPAGNLQAIGAPAIGRLLTSATVTTSVSSSAQIGHFLIRGSSRESAYVRVFEDMDGPRSERSGDGWVHRAVFQRDGYRQAVTVRVGRDGDVSVERS